MRNFSEVEAKPKPSSILGHSSLGIKPERIQEQSNAKLPGKERSFNFGTRKHRFLSCLWGLHDPDFAWMTGDSRGPWGAEFGGREWPSQIKMASHMLRLPWGSQNVC